MALNYVWIFFFIIAFVVALVKTIFFSDFEVFSDLTNSLFDNGKLGFELSIGLTGALAFWLGIMKIGERAGVINLIAKLLGPFFSKIFPEIPKNHPAIGSMVMNFSANMLGLDNAATPLGLKAMDQLQEVNPNKSVASNAQILFLVLNTSGLTLIPVSIMTYRSVEGSSGPADVFIPILIATFCSSMFGLLLVSAIQKLNIFNRVVLAYLFSAFLLIGGLIYYAANLSKEELELFSGTLSGVILFGIIISFMSVALYRKINVYESFIEGAKEGFGVAIKIIPYLVAILCAIGAFRASGAMDILIEGIRMCFEGLGTDARFVDALPTGIMKPFSGSGARGLMVDSWNAFKTETTSGADTFVGQLTSIMQGSTETTFYVLAVYFGAVNIKKTRYALGIGLLVDLVGLIASIFIGYLFFG